MSSCRVEAAGIGDSKQCLIDVKLVEAIISYFILHNFPGQNVVGTCHGSDFENIHEVILVISIF